MTFFYIMHIAVCVLLIAIILFQDGKTGGLVSVADSSQSVFGAKGASSFLTKLTSGLAILFMVLTLLLAYRGTGSQSIAADHAPATQNTNAEISEPEASGNGNSIDVSGDLAPSIQGTEKIKQSDLTPEQRKQLGLDKGEEPSEPESEKKDENQ